MYLREMGTVPLLTREGEVAIAKRIERGKNYSSRAITRTLVVTKEVMALSDVLKKSEVNLRDLIVVVEEELTEAKLEKHRKEDHRRDRQDRKGLQGVLGLPEAVRQAQEALP